MPPSTVGTSITNLAVIPFLQRKAFYANGCFWVFYSDGTNIVYRTSTDGSSWSSPTVLKAGIYGRYFGVWFDGTYLHYAHALESSSYGLYYRRGTPNSDGIITWSAPEQTVHQASGTYYYYPQICVDSGGYAWIAVRRYPTGYEPVIFKNANNDGTWSTASGFPYTLESGVNRPPKVIPLTNQKIVVFWMSGTSNVLRAKLWSGSSWEATENATSSNLQSASSFSPVNEGDDIHLVFLKQTTYDVVYQKRTYGSGWGSEETIQSSTISSSFPQLAKNPVNNDLYCFWAGFPTADHIYYKKRSGTTWNVDPTDWIDESTEHLTFNNFLISYYQSYTAKIAVIYVRKTGSPYDVRHHYLPMVTYTISGVTRDANGNPLSNCVVWLFRTNDKLFVEQTTSDANGNYSFTVNDNMTEYFVRAHKDGTPSVFGTTDDNLTGS